jgi:uncharacterized Fe-S cluster-containing radical SAM superfamily protein
MPTIDTDDFSARLRERSVRPGTRQVLISRIDGSEQANDLTEPTNCAGYGRIRHFRHTTPVPWPPNPLPIEPASYRLGVVPQEIMTAQVFQNASCNWRCWYCFVPFSLLSANEERSGWLTADQMVELYLAEADRPLIIDCSGGQPDLVPEWVPWMMEALEQAGVAGQTYLWSDDNLSNDYFWQYLNQDWRRLLESYRNYGRVCCFKGYNAESFAFNTKADPALFRRQFELFQRLMGTGIDLYAYATFTTPDAQGLERDMTNFVDDLMALHPNLPLRLVPLRIENYGVVQHRTGPAHDYALEAQEEAILAWNQLMDERFTPDRRQIAMPLIAIL